MGFLNSYFRMTALADKLDERSDVAGNLSSMQSKLDALNATMAPALPSDPVHRVDATASVVTAQPTGAQINGALLVNLQLLVMLPSGVPLPVATSSLVPALALARAQAGGRVAVTLDPSKPESLVVDWQRAA